jgi:hypothetical protein
MPVTVQTVQWPFLIAIVIGSSAFLAAVWKIAGMVRAMTAPLRQFMSEHDVLWEDYNIRTGGKYRRATGRGAPPDPEEFYRTHHDLEVRGE